MTTIHAEVQGDRAVLPRAELDRLIELARLSEEITLETVANGNAPHDYDEDDIDAPDMLRLAAASRAWDWLRDEPDLYSMDDVKRP